MALFLGWETAPDTAVCNSEHASTDGCTQESAHISDVASAYSFEHESTVSSGYASAYISEHCSHHQGFKHGSSDSSGCFFTKVLYTVLMLILEMDLIVALYLMTHLTQVSEIKPVLMGEHCYSESQFPHNNLVEASCSYSDEPLDVQSLYGDVFSDEDVQPPKKCARCPLFPPTSLSVDFVDFSDKVSVSAIILESLWNKASKLLSTSNAIAVAPGLDLNSHTVFCTSSNRPHLVQAKKTGPVV